MATRTATPKSKTTEVRIEQYRVRFDRRAQAALCAQIAGACRLVWNILLADCERRYRLARAYGQWTDFPPEDRPDLSTSFFTLGKRFTDLRSRPDAAWVRAFLGSPWGRRYRDMDLSWLRDLPYAPVRYTLKYLADAYTRFHAVWDVAATQGKTLGVRKSDGKPKGFPKYKKKFDKDDGFTIPDNVRMDGDRLHIPKVGWVRLEGSGVYRGHKPKQVRIRKEGTEEHPKWYAYVFHEVPVDRLKPPAWTGAVGVDRNVGQATDSDGEVYEVPDDPKLDANIKRKQRQADKARARSKANGQPMSNRGRRICGQLKKRQRKQKRRRENAAHQHSRKLADTAHTVVIEDLNTKAMTRSAKGTVTEPGKNVKQKAGLNRGILKSNWGRTERMLDYKAGQVLKVPPAYTSQTCAACGHVDKANRRTQAHFRCTACGHTANADRNAAQNILARGLALCPTARGTGAAARREALGPCPLPVATVKSTSTTREQGMPSRPRGSPPWYTGI
ncbi:MAG: transposase [Caldilineaceae bacterium]|nr:transposase [Caldilineaceae bacterium]